MTALDGAHCRVGSGQPACQRPDVIPGTWRAWQKAAMMPRAEMPGAGTVFEVIVLWGNKGHDEKAFRDPPWAPRDRFPIQLVLC